MNKHPTLSSEDLDMRDMVDELQQWVSHLASETRVPPRCRLLECLECVKRIIKTKDSISEESARCITEAHRLLLIRGSLPSYLKEECLGTLLVKGRLLYPNLGTEANAPKQYNLVFQLYMGAILHKGGCEEICIESNGTDVTGIFAGTPIAVECKRLYSRKRIERVVKHATDQITGRPSASNEIRIIAIDISPILIHEHSFMRRLALFPKYHKQLADHVADDLYNQVKYLKPNIWFEAVVPIRTPCPKLTSLWLSKPRTWDSNTYRACRAIIQSMGHPFSGGRTSR